ncbi:uncharacterized protein PAC_10353 [Phialocephala subalpina]|uniref:AB hydrolase-1 domain-containing protein n=1 Tax=Phialocephala subalpina TaxID=576137 RepID=A0A1L7X604_9HELO|nr:uncharacterized protein PAC_10353 [Phialocephala subalpina]
MIQRNLSALTLLAPSHLALFLPELPSFREYDWRSHDIALNESQGAAQIAILQQMTGFIREGRYTGSFGKPSKIVHVGHSFGSFISNALIATTPKLSDAAILTGIGYSNGDKLRNFLEGWALRIASHKPLEDGQAETSTTSQELIRFPMLPPSSTEIATIRKFSAPAFTKPVMVISGEFDPLFVGVIAWVFLSIPPRKPSFPMQRTFKLLYIHQWDTGSTSATTLLEPRQGWDIENAGRLGIGFNDLDLDLDLLVIIWMQ